VPTIGVLAVATPGSGTILAPVSGGPARSSYIDGQNVRFEFRSDQVRRLAELAAELVRLKVDLIVTWFTPAARAAKPSHRVERRDGETIVEGLPRRDPSGRKNPAPKAGSPVVVVSAEDGCAPLLGLVDRAWRLSERAVRCAPLSGLVDRA
jgi:hypothetical protein